MNHRENLLAAMRRQRCDRVPFQFSMCDSLKEELLRRYGTDDVVKAFDMPVQYIELPPATVKIDHSIYHKHPETLSSIDEWGVGYQRGSVAHFAKFVSPMADFDSPEQVEAYPFPDVEEPARWQAVREQVEKAHAQGRAAAFFAIQVFEPAWYLRGLDNLLVDFISDEEMAAACMNKMTDAQCKIATLAAKSGVDMIVFGDDVGTQRAMMMSVEVWRRWVKPATAATIAAAKAVNPDVLAMYHSDGTIYDIIPELIEIGVDILNPVQPECVDPILLKRLYGDRLSFWGTVGTQTTMPFGTPEEVREKVRLMIETVGAGGGLTIAPTHLLEPEVPWENIEAFLQAVRDFGSYV
ncbi:MAG: uroporphyrinogen decarboxylase family protein [Oscillospiraceae bacterium]